MSSVDEEIFEITDFTCGTDWERFVADLETRIREWQLNQDAPVSEISSEKKNEQDYASLTKLDRLVDELKYGDKTEFKVSYFYGHSSAAPPSSSKTTSNIASPQVQAKKLVKGDESGENSHYSYIPSAVRGLMEPNVDFFHESVDTGHHIVRYYGLRRFLVLEPYSFASPSHILSDDSFINLLMSAVIVASLNTNCDIPIFLQVTDQWRWVYNGICQNTNTRTRFEMVHLRNPPPKCYYLSGILDLFKEHVACALASAPPVKVSVHITYQLKESLYSGWPSETETMEGSLEVLHGVKDFARLPFGAIQDTIDKLYLATTWLNLNEDMLVENHVYSDLDPLAAPHWNCSVDFADGGVMLMSEALSSFLKLLIVYKNADDVLGPLAPETPAAASALGRLTHSNWLADLNLSPSATNILNVASSPRSNSHLPLDDAALGRLLQFLFPDADLEKADGDAKYKNLGDKGSGVSSSGRIDRMKTPPGSAVSLQSVGAKTESSSGFSTKREEPSKIETSLRKSKTAPVDSLTSRLALALCHLANSMQGLQTACHLWREFVLELRFRWEQGIALPGFDDSNPSLSDCLLHQKLQMLNCCILHKIKRGKHRETPDDAISSTDEFFDCYENVTEIDSATASKPEGRLGPLAPDSCLLENRNDQLYIPVTQDPAPLTEDVLEQYGQMLTNLGTSEESALTRAKMQTPSLLSDMEAFKAANPGAVLGDFIRWYSPRDWIEEEDRESGEIKGKLSERMSIPGNLWKEVWDNSRPIPVCRQRRLFDDTREAEKILHWLQEMQMAIVAKHLSPALFHCTLLQLHEEAGIVNGLLANKWIILGHHFVQGTQSGLINYEDIRSEINEMEREVSRYRTLVGRLSSSSRLKDSAGSDVDVDVDAEIRKLALELLVQKDVKILGASRGFMGQLFTNMFMNDERMQCKSESDITPRFPPYSSKEYVLRWMVPRPQAKSRQCPQRCYVHVKPNEFRSASAFTEDVVFFLPD